MVRNQSSSAMQKLAGFISVLGLIILVIQNISFYIDIVVSNSVNGTLGTDLFRLTLTIDLIGFSLLGIGLVIQGITNKKFITLSLGGLFILLWVGFSLDWRLYLDFWNLHLINTTNTTDISAFINNTINTVYNLMLPGAIVLGIGLILSIYGLSNKKLDLILVLIYSILNIVLTFYVIIGLVLKIFILPVLGVLIFLIFALREYKTPS